MRLPDEPAVEPSSENIEKTDVPRPRMGSLLSGHPDRRRIDSDVRAFLRQPSTPWITFDKDGNPSRLSPGEILPVARSSIHADHGFFPATAIIDAGQAKLEPSSVAVASDLSDEPAHEPDPFPTRASAPWRRVIGAALIGIALVATAGAGVSALRADGAVEPARATASTPPANAQPSEAPPPDLALGPAAAPPTGAKPAAAPVEAPPVKATAKKYGRLTIDGPARHVNVFLDGKRLLGRGTRSFSVLCGTHTIAVGNKIDAKDVDVPCSAELTITN